MKFDYVIGNPPYQEDQNGRTLPVYDLFMEASYQISDKVELITPGRFLFNAGQTHKTWNQQILNDEHFKVLYYDSDGKRTFSGVDIKGGVAITYHDNTANFGAIGTFIPFNELRSVVDKIKKRNDFDSLTNHMYTSTKYNLSAIYADHPEYNQYVKSDGRHSQIDTNSFGRMPIFTPNKPNDTDNYIQMFGRYNNQREYWWVKRKYVNDSGNIDNWKVFVSKANGTGALGETLSTPTVGSPQIGSTQSFIGIGALNTQNEAESLLKYIKSKFFRALLGTLKITQDNSPEKWANIPMQNFTQNSDIDWNRAVYDIDQQLYRKYGLSSEEISFIENNVKEMD